MNFRSGSKLLQGPGQINKQKKIADSRRGGGSDHPPPPPKKKTPVSAHGGLHYIVPKKATFRSSLQINKNSSFWVKVLTGK